MLGARAMAATASGISKISERSPQPLHLGAFTYPGPANTYLQAVESSPSLSDGSAAQQSNSPL